MKMGKASWEKLLHLIELAKSEPELSAILRSGKPNEVTAALQARADLTMDDLGEIFTDLEYIADRNSLQWWSPLK
jgi:hypothetical protein